MPIWFQILALAGMICPVTFPGFQAPIQATQISCTALSPSLLSLQESTNDTLADKAVNFDEEDFRDQRNSDSLCAFLEIGNTRNSINCQLQKADVSCRIAKHARIYLLCELLI